MGDRQWEAGVGGCQVTGEIRTSKTKETQMTTKTVVRTILAVVIAALLGGASLIIARSGAGAGVEVPAGFVH